MLGKKEPLRRLGILSSMSPARVANSRWEGAVAFGGSRVVRFLAAGTNLLGGLTSINLASRAGQRH